MRRLFPLYLVVVWVAACQEESHDNAIINWAQVTPLYESIEEQHVALVAIYDTLAPALPDSMQMRYADMMRLYDELAPMHDFVTYGGPIGGPVAGTQTDIANMDPGQMRMLDVDMAAMQVEFADQLKSLGYLEIAEMHELMARYYDDVLFLTGDLEQ